MRVGNEDNNGNVLHFIIIIMISLTGKSYIISLGTRNIDKIKKKATDKRKCRRLMYTEPKQVLSFFNNRFI